MSLQEKDVEKYIKENSKSALNRVSSILGTEISMQSFNGMIGGKNDTYTVNPLNFETAEEYISEWKANHKKIFESEKNAIYEKSSHRIDELLKESDIAKFIENYLARTYFRKHSK
ncbi:topoisomerase [Paenibacillus illinoisensis]|uniref:topoisomerase n=1 Tax=Paenibacillus illinoisensis TaxID=59845 RepID=UPI0030168E5F